jgi:hemoglobin
MQDREIYVPPGGPGPIPSLSPEIYNAMGREGVFQMLSAVYRELETSSIRPLFGEDMQKASQRSAAFYVQLLGGPPLYNTQYGNPMMRRRHFPFVIDEAARKVWIGCFFKALENADDYGFPPEHLETFKSWLEGFSRWMVNTASE